MICKKLSVVALSGLTAALSLSALAQDTTMSSSTTTSSTTMSGDMSMSGGGSMGMSMQPTMVSGTVLRYYTDRSGFVSAMDVQTPEGIRMVRFAPGMANRLYGTYPVGGTISGYVQPSMSMGTTRYDLVSVGEQMPAAGMMMPSMVSDIEMLKAEPFIQLGSKMTQFTGTLDRLVTDDIGNVLALVLKDSSMGNMAAMSNASMTTDGSMAASTDASMGGGMMGGGMMGGGMMGGGMMGQGMTLVRIPSELRHSTTGRPASPRASGLFKGAMVEVVGFDEAPRYGVVSNYGRRVVANALVVDGRAVGALGIPMMMADSGNDLTRMSMGGTPTAEETSAMGMGYSTYGTSGMSSDGSMSNGMTNDPSATTGTTGPTGGTPGAGS
jgi:hypothetical protein